MGAAAGDIAINVDGAADGPAKAAAAGDPSPPPSGAPKPGGRLFFLDWLRTALTALVVVHHCINLIVPEPDPISFGISYRWRRWPTSVDFMGLSAILGSDQAYFMGLFFLLAGYCTPSSLARKGPARYLGDRCLRLLVPLAAYELLLGPAVYAIAQKGATLDFGPEGLAEAPSVYRWYFQRYIAVGHNPMWFVALLFIFDLIYVACASASAALRTRRRANAAGGSGRVEGEPEAAGGAALPIKEVAPPPVEPFTPRQMASFMVPFALYSIVVMYGIRISSVGDSWTNVGVNFWVAFTVPAFFLGARLKRCNALQRLPERFCFACMAVALVVFSLGFAMEWGMRLNAGIDTRPPQMTVGWRFFYTFTEQVFAVLWSAGLLAFFRRFANCDYRPAAAAAGGGGGCCVGACTPSWRGLAAALVGSAYAGYIIHPLFVTGFAVLLNMAALPPAGWVATLCVCATVSTFLAAMAVKAIPGAGRIL
ncbi:MAG: hypothetical protein J3K34DRAFT_164758 [Monoraphidium minutum]|nr:MAG: hypothetical protein J3K34DRAFT_164758 [Monoraphidium minutum]